MMRCVTKLFLKLIVSIYYSCVRHQLSDHVSLLPVLARVLHQLPVTCQARTLKLLQLIRIIVSGVRINRREAWLTSFIGDLVSHLTPSSDLSSPSLFILCSLCQGNFISTKILMSQLSPATLTSIYSTSTSSTSDQVCYEILLHHLNSLHLSPVSPHPDKQEELLPKIIDVFCSSYTNDDLPMMCLLTTFITSLSTTAQIRDTLAQQDCVSQTQQLVVISDFSEGFNLQSANQLFSFIKIMINTYSSDIISMFDICHKLVLARLDSKPLSNLGTALNLVTTIFTKIDFTNMSDAVARNLKFQVDQLLPSLLNVFVDISKSSSSSNSASKMSGKSSTKKLDIDREAVTSCSECLVLLQIIAETSLDGWTKTVAVGVKSSKMHQTFKTICENLKDLRSKAQLSIEMMSVALVLGEVDSGWRTVEGELFGDKERVRLVLDLIRMDNVERSLMKKALTLLGNIENPLEHEDEVEDKSKPSVLMNDDVELSADQMSKIENMIENVGAAVEKLELDDVMTDVLELADVRRGHERRQISHLTSALTAADERLVTQNQALLEREEQVRRLERLVSGLVTQLSASREELRDIRAQHGDLSREADQTRDRLARELEETRAHVQSLTDQRDSLSEKVVKYKGQVVSLTQDLEQYKENQEQLEKRLRQEMKVKEEVTVTLVKREEKLKKKERLLEEEMVAREKVEKEVRIIDNTFEESKDRTIFTRRCKFETSYSSRCCPYIRSEILWTCPQHHWTCSRCLRNIFTILYHRIF